MFYFLDVRTLLISRQVASIGLLESLQKRLICIGIISNVYRAVKATGNLVIFTVPFKKICRRNLLNTLGTHANTNCINSLRGILRINWNTSFEAVLLLRHWDFDFIKYFFGLETFTFLLRHLRLLTNYALFDSARNFSLRRTFVGVV